MINKESGMIDPEAYEDLEDADKEALKKIERLVTAVEKIAVTLEQIKENL